MSGYVVKYHVKTGITIPQVTAEFPIPRNQSGQYFAGMFNLKIKLKYNLLFNSKRLFSY